MLKKSIIFIFLLIFCNTYAFANPVPAFCLAGWLDYECCKGISRIRETTPNGEFTWYDTFGSRIRETTPNGEETWYDTFGSRIRETTPNGEETWYDTFGSRIRETAPNGKETWYDTF